MVSELYVVDLGALPYASALELQRDVARRRITGEIAEDVLLLVEHPPVVTLGRTAKGSNLIASPEYLASHGVELFEVERGGDITFHGPGQLVGYPILDLQPDRCDVHKYVRDLEEVMIRAAGDFGIRAGRVEGLSGAWVGADKLGAIGVRISRWITSHGFALNVTTDLEYFNLIVPCGIASGGVTSLTRVAGTEVNMADAEAAVAAHFSQVFARD